MRSQAYHHTKGLNITNFGDAGATVVAMFEEPHGLAHTPTHIAFDGANGALLEIRGGDLKPAAKTISTLIGLHVAHFADTGLRLLFFLCGVMGSAMVATGLVLWSLARLPKAEAQPYLGLRLVQALNIGSIAGLPAAIAVYFLANRLLPLGLADRAEWEIRAFFGAWIVAALIPLARPHRRAWSEMLVLVFRPLPRRRGGRHRHGRGAPLASARRRRGAVPVVRRGDAGARRPVRVRRSQGRALPGPVPHGASVRAGARGPGGAGPRMTPAILALNLGLSFAALAALCLSLNRHHAEIFVTKPSGRRVVLLRVLGWAGLVLLLSYCPGCRSRSRSRDDGRHAPAFRLTAGLAAASRLLRVTVVFHRGRRIRPSRDAPRR